MWEILLVLLMLKQLIWELHLTYFDFHFLARPFVKRFLFLVAEAFCHIWSMRRSKFPEVQTQHTVHPLWLTWQFSSHTGSNIVQVSPSGIWHVSFPQFYSVTLCCSLCVCVCGGGAATSALNTIISDQKKWRWKTVFWCLECSTSPSTHQIHPVCKG